MDVPVRDAGAADDRVVLHTEVNDSFSTVCEVTYSMLFHDSFSVFVVACYPCIDISKQELDVVPWNVVNYFLQ